MFENVDVAAEFGRASQRVAKGQWVLFESVFMMISNQPYVLCVQLWASVWSGDQTMIHLSDSCF